MQTVQRKIEVKGASPLYLSADDFPLLKGEKHEQFFVRVDKYTINRYWDNKGVRERETLFYPSKCGIAEIVENKKSDKKTLQALPLWFVMMYDRLLDSGKADFISFSEVEMKIKRRKWYSPYKKNKEESGVTKKLKLIPRIKRFKLNTITRVKLNLRLS